MRQKAVEALREHLSRDILVIRDYIDDKPKTWWMPFNYFWGRTIKEFLTEQGYGELADDYVKLVEEAVGR